MDKKYYLRFENKFRGDRDEIISRLGSYDGIIRFLKKHHENPNALDIGSGRGEWLQKCKKEGLSGMGIEIDSEMVVLSRKYNLDVIEGDALDALKNIQSKSYSLITSFHLIEHIDNQKIENIIHECRRILKDNGLMILETPSIDNLIVSSRQFYLDPTHVNPINPDGIKFLIEQCGFQKVNYYFINGGPLQNANKFSLTKVFNGVGQDLLVIAITERGEAENFFCSKDNWMEDVNVAVGTMQTSIEFDESARELENRVTEMEDIIKTQERHIQDLIREQNKILNSAPVRLFEAFKCKYYNLKSIFSKIKYKAFSKLPIICKKIIKRLLREVAFILKSFLKFLSYIFIKIRCNYMHIIINKAIYIVDQRLRFKNYAKMSRLVEKDKNKTLSNHFFSSLGAKKIYHDIIKNKNKK
tara:strand:+ start:1166 stop:2404 length:1239 start_codon:yes stop_codon:yes gene_type:complete